MRNLTTAAITAVTAETVFRTVAVELDFDSGVVRVAGTPFPITIGGNVFTGAGSLGKLSTADEGSDLQSYSMTATLAGIPRDLVALTLTEPYQGRAATVWDVPLDPTTLAPIADPIIIFRGLMDVMTVAHGATSAVSIAITNRLADWERARARLFSDEEQQRRYSGDLGLQYAALMENKEIVWPASKWFTDHP